MRAHEQAAHGLALMALSTTLACADAGADTDPLDPDLIRELSMAQGSATGDAHSGLWQFEFETESCDCPSLELDGQSHDLCAIASIGSLDLELIEAGGALAIPSGPDAQFGVLTGAIEADGSFSVASHHDATTVLGPLESLARMDGQFGDNLMGWAAQRLIGEVAGDGIDCRWVGNFVANPS